MDEKLTINYYYYIRSPKSSPDGKMVAVVFCSRGCDNYGDDNIYLYDLQARNGFKQIYSRSDYNYFDWSSEGEWIVFSENGADMYKIRKDGSEKTLL
ncbi:MAG: TolB family protein [bacterium]